MLFLWQKTQIRKKERGLGLCFKCLNSGHISRECRARIKCTKYNSGHNVVMCGVRLELSPKKEEREDGVNSDKADDVTLLSGQGDNCTILQTAKVQVSSSDGTVIIAQVMFDNGAGIC